MIRLTIIVATLCFLAGLANGIGDALQFRYKQSFAADWNPEFWNPKKSFTAKYAKDKEGVLIPAPDKLYYRLFNLQYKERFPLSATALSWATDAWHLAKCVFNTSLQLALALLIIAAFTQWKNKEWQRWQYAIAYSVVVFVEASIQAAGFHVFYTLL
ncbi:MAG: hypothetical protein AAFP77_19700 [Bacteroidota bacterium]